MEAIDYVYFSGLVAAIIALAAIPFFAAISISWRSSLPAKWRFALLCTVLVYGVAAIISIIWLPLEMASNMLAPQLDHDGHSTISRTLFQLGDLGIALSGVAALVASLIIPLRLRRSWPAIIAAVGANNSFKPKPLRGSA